jgi:hypothetical protein
MALLVGFGLAAAFWVLVLWRGRPDRPSEELATLPAGSDQRRAEALSAR